MKNLNAKLMLMSMSMMLVMTGGAVSKQVHATESKSNEFAELEYVYESKAPEVEAAELSSTFTSEKEIEVYIKTNRTDIKNIVVSAWSGGAYSNFATSKEATFDALRGIYTVTFQVNEIMDTKTSEVSNSPETLFSFDAMVYSTNGAMTYLALDDVQYAANGFVA